MPRATLDAPPKAPPRTGLVASAPELTDGTDLWEQGFEYEAEECTGAAVADPCLSATKTITSGSRSVTYDPFVVWAGEQCSTFGWNSRDWKGRARRLLEACESKAIADELQNGTRATASGWGNPFLTKTGVDLLTANAGMPAANALACLESAIADCSCGVGMIHATRGIATLWAAQMLLFRDGDDLRTINGTIVIADAGYSRVTPAGASVTAGVTWAYATSPVYIRRGQIKILPDTLAQATNRANNTTEFRAERMAAAWWDGCCHAAAGVQITDCV